MNRRHVVRRPDASRRRDTGGMRQPRAMIRRLPCGTWRGGTSRTGMYRRGPRAKGMRYRVVGCRPRQARRKGQCDRLDTGPTNHQAKRQRSHGRNAGLLMSGERIIHVVQGEYAISGRADTMLTTVLGSCVAACIYDDRRRIGGMNHFLLPGGTAGGDMRFAAASMERLVNALLKRGAERARLQAKLFGGARIIPGLLDIGRRNGDAALQFLQSENIPCPAMSLGGNRARRVRFWPATGRAQQLLLDPSFGDPRSGAAPEPGSIDLF